MTDGETRTLGTIQLINLDKENREVVKAAIDWLSEANRGCLLLCQAFFKTKSAQACQSPEYEVLSHAGFTVWKDCNIVTFFNYDMAHTPFVTNSSA